MPHPVDTLTKPIYSKHPSYKVFKKLYRHRNRYKVNDHIVIVCFYHIVSGQKQYHDIDYYIRRCQDRTLSAGDIKFEFKRLVITNKVICFFGVEGYDAFLLNRRSTGIRFINRVPELSIYHKDFPRVYHEWTREINGLKNFIDYRYVMEIAKISSNRFKNVAANIKSARTIYISSLKGPDVPRQNQ